MTPTWRALDALTKRLIERRGELAELVAAERSTRLATYAASAETSVSGRDREADAATDHFHVEITKLRAAIQGDEDLRAYLTLAIDHGVEVIGADQ